MALRGPRFSGDPVLEECQAGRHRMMAPEDGVPVMRVQAALIELGRFVGDAGADGIFGQATGDAVSEYKRSKGLEPDDPVVGVGTSTALDDDLFVDPPTLDPAFAEFAPAVVEHRVEPFVARELAAMITAPLDSWRRMIAVGALADLNSGALLGIVAQSRAIDLRDAFLAVADSPQPNGLGAEDFFDDAIVARGALGNTQIFLAGGEARSFIIVADEVILGRASIVRTATGERAAVDLLGVVVHELTHARNRENIRALVDTPDTDADVYADTALAQARSAVGPTANVLHNYVQEIVARHLHWIVRQEVAGTPGSIALLGLQADRLAFAALFYFVEFPAVFDSNGYGAGINAQGDAVRFRQLELWLGLCATQTFSDDAAQDQQATLLFQAAATVCADQQTNPTLDFPDDDGLVPLPPDFH